MLHGELVVVSQSHSVEANQEEYHQDNHDNHGCNHDVQRRSRFIKLLGTRFKLPVLSRLFLHIEVDIPVIIAQRFIVNSRINQRQLLTDRGNQVGCPLYDRITV